ncbi:hypothetical protein SAMN06272765_3367 [Streptomyces sp. Ag109_G2-15]|nr:hypothetical protein SAMN06272765_3367 [Streptomyces sp. Ag109_G2-15]
MPKGTPKALPSRDGRARGAISQAAELLLVEPDEDEDDEDVDEDDFESDEEELDDEELDGFDAGLLLDVEPRESLR